MGQPIQPRIHWYATQIARRVIILFALVFLASIIHRVFTSIHHVALGAFLLVGIFLAGVINYYFRMFSEKGKHRQEYFISVLFVLLLIVTMFALVYDEPMNDGRSYFVQGGVKGDISFPDALYFSATTVTTLGYGDILPYGVYRLFVVVEVMTGMIYIASMVYVLTRELDK